MFVITRSSEFEFSSQETEVYAKFVTLLSKFDEQAKKQVTFAKKLPYANKYSMSFQVVSDATKDLEELWLLYNYTGFLNSTSPNL